jgi:hypothetical protein
MVRLGLGGCVFELDVPRPPERLHFALADLDVPSAEPLQARWSIELEAGASDEPGSPPRSVLLEWSLDPKAHRIRFSGRFPIRVAAPFLHEAMRAVLRLHGRLALHASALVPAGRAKALLLIGGSGYGKSSLTWNCLARGGRVVSDDLVGLYQDARGRLALCPLRRTIAVPQDALGSRCPPNGVWETRPGLRKLRFDPLELRPNARLDPAVAQRLVFLDRGGARRIRELRPHQAFERLLEQTPSLWLDAAARKNLELLRRLADETKAVVATLTKACLTDDTILDELAA